MAKNIRAEFESCIDELCVSVEEFPWANKDAYIHWVGQTYYIVKHTTRFLGLAAGMFNIEQDYFHQKALAHIREEHGHDKLALRDVQALGAQIGHIQELPETQALYQGQYFFIHQYGPLSHYGYSLLLEGLAAVKGQWILEQVERHHGPKAASFIRVHALEDVNHFNDTVGILDRISDLDRSFVLKNMYESRPRYALMLKAIKEHVELNNQRPGVAAA